MDLLDPFPFRTFEADGKFFQTVVVAFFLLHNSPWWREEASAHEPA